MRIEQEKVELFMRRIGDAVNDKPTLVEPALTLRRYQFILEELREYDRAVKNHNLVGVADALGDLLYVVLGLACLHGLDAQSIFEEVHRSNMTKEVLPIEDRDNFKLCRKGVNYRPPRIAELLFIQSTGLEEESYR